jgi:hypothetical protein
VIFVGKTAESGVCVAGMKLSGVCAAAIVGKARETRMGRSSIFVIMARVRDQCIRQDSTGQRCHRVRCLDTDTSVRGRPNLLPGCFDPIAKESRLLRQRLIGQEGTCQERLVSLSGPSAGRLAQSQMSTTSGVHSTLTMQNVLLRSTEVMLRVLLLH